MSRLYIMTLLLAVAGMAGADGKRIELKNGALYFAGGKTIQIKVPKPAFDVPPGEAPGQSKVSGISDNGQLAAVLDMGAMSVTVYDVAGKKKQEIKKVGARNSVAISDQGLVVVWGAVQGHPMRPVLQHGAAVYTATGKLAKSLDRIPMGRVHVRFLHTGKVAVLVLPTPGVMVVWANGESWQKSFVPKDDLGNRDYVIGDVAVARTKLRLVCTIMGLGGIGTPTDTQIFMYTVDPERRQESGSHEWTQRGAKFGPGSIALSPDGARLFTIEPRIIRCFDLQKNRQEWIDVIGHPDLGTVQPQRIGAIHAGDQCVASAQLVPTGIGWRVLYSVYGLDGKRISRYHAKSDPARGVNHFLSDEIAADRADGPFWTVSTDGKTLETLAPKTKISLTK